MKKYYGRYYRWKGMPLDSYSKEELIEIIVRLNNKYDDNVAEHKRQLEFLKSSKEEMPKWLKEETLRKQKELKNLLPLWQETFYRLFGL